MDPATQFAHRASVLADPPTSPWPAAHVFTVNAPQAPPPAALENVPEPQATQLESVPSVPATTPCPTGHVRAVCTVQEAPAPVECFPEVHCVHLASAARVKLVNLKSATHTGADTTVHAVATLVPLFHVAPSEHWLQWPSADAVAGTNFLPGPHMLIVTGAHAFALFPAFHAVPATHDVHVASCAVVAAVKPFPLTHDVTATAMHALDDSFGL